MPTHRKLLGRRVSFELSYQPHRKFRRKKEIHRLRYLLKITMEEDAHAVSPSRPVVEISDQILLVVGIFLSIIGRFRVH